MKSSNIISNGNIGVLHLDTHKESRVGFQWKVDLTYIHQNFPFALQSRVQSSHNHSHYLTARNSNPLSSVGTDEVTGELAVDGQRGLRHTRGNDNSIKMLPLTEVKGNLKN